MNEPIVPTTVMMPEKPQKELGSLWQPGAKHFFKDSRAHQVGDIITVIVSEASKAESKGKTETTRTVENTSGINNLLNLEGLLTNRGVAPGAASLLDTESEREFIGDASTDREDTLTANIAAVVTQVLPNGYLVIRGKRQVIVNYEMQEMTLQGIIRPADVSATNTIASEKIAEARIAYVGKGVVDESQTAPAGIRFIDKWLPF
jgi:flagellar L-ring protein precursor FlgH